MAIKAEVVHVTPALAADYLERNTHNRARSDVYVDKLIRDLKAGKWKLTHQGVAFDERGVLIDGQHRLWAVFLSGIAVDMMVSSGWPEGTQLVIDSHNVRQTQDYLMLTDKYGKVRKAEAGMLRRLLKGASKVWPKLTHSEMDEEFTRYRKAIQFALECFPDKRGRITIIPVYCAIARAYYSPFDNDDIARFCKILVTGEGAKTKRDQTVMHMRESLLAGQPGTQGRPWSPDSVYQRVESALLAYLQGEYKRRVQPRVLRELFKLPHERHDRVVFRHKEKGLGKIQYKVLRHIRTHKKGVKFSTRDITSALDIGADVARPILDAFVDAGWLKLVERGRGRSRHKGGNVYEYVDKT